MKSSILQTLIGKQVYPQIMLASKDNVVDKTYYVLPFCLVITL